METIEPEAYMIEFVRWLARNEVQVCKKNGRMFVRANMTGMDETDRKMLAEFEMMVLSRNN